VIFYAVDGHDTLLANSDLGPQPRLKADLQKLAFDFGDSFGE